MLAMPSAFLVKELSAEILAGAANWYNAAPTRRVSAAGLALLQAKLSRNSNQIARGPIRRFKSYMPSQAVGLSASAIEGRKRRGPAFSTLACSSEGSLNERRQGADFQEQ